MFDDGFALLGKKGEVGVAEGNTTCFLKFRASYEANSRLGLPSGSA